MNKDFKIIDLTHTLSPEIPTWDGGCGFEMELTLDYKDCTPPDLFRKHSLKMESGIGTHMDAPAHVIPNGRTIDKIALEELVTNCVMIDVSAESDENYIIMPEAVEKFEKEHREIKGGSFVIFYTGWDKYWNDPEKYINNHKFPSVDVSTAELLLKRNIAGLGIDTLSADTGADGFPVHRAILGSDKYLVENIANAKELPPTGAKILVLPMKIIDGTEAPVRLVALV
ncbi:MAG: cyclase family protein [Candidatus Pacebacteria bacterium]|nr:cyclase family protein [Candidatus Paceibacterota bacterium]MBP9851280.1 cyclase family protein [Candidatus Paceibacterota bacterium]